MIIFSIEQGLRIHIVKIENAIQMWFTLQTQYEQSNLTIIYLTVKDLIQSKQSNFKFIQDYADSLKRAAIKCSDIGNTVALWMLSNLFLLDLNESLEPYIFDLIQSIKINKTGLSIENMTIALVDHDKRIHDEKNFSSKSMVAQFDKKSKFRNNSRFRKRLNKKCSHCELEDHSEQDCWFLHSKLRSDEWKSSQERKNLAKEEHDFGKSSKVRIVRSMKVFIVCRADSHIEVWWIDTEAENHVCYNKDLFNEQSYRKIIDNSIVTANNEAVFIVGKDSIIIDILLKDQSIKIRLNDVYHCSGLHYNLMSVGQVKVKEYTCSIKNGKFRFMNTENVVALIGSRNDGEAYFVNTPTNFSNSRSVILTSRTSVKASWRQWHKRLAHLNMTDVKRLANMSIDIDVNSVNSLENEEFPESVCEACATGKQHRISSRKPHIRATKIDELVHTNLVGDGKISKIDEKAKYVTTMIDDYSEYTTTYLLERKFDLQGVLRNYLTLMKTQSTSVHRLRSDNEGEYADHRIIELLEEHEVKWESTTFYNSSQNEVAERCFRILFERTRAILTSVKLPVRLWGKAIMTVIYLKNRSSTTALNQITLYEAWHGKKPDLSNLHTFECIVYHHVKEAHRKLDDKSLKCQFLSYERVNQFRLWNGKKVLISSHVQWDEVIIEVEEYDEDLSVLSFDEQINDESFPQKSSSIITENAKIAKILDDYPIRTSSTSKRTIVSSTSVASQKARSRPSELESSEPSSSDSDASSEHLKRVIAEPVDYRALNDPWAKGNNRGFASRANWVQIESNTSQTVKQARASLDWEQWKLAFRSELDAHTKNDTFTLETPSSNRWILSTRWIIIIKRGPKEKMIKYKARWMCKEFRQEQRIDYDETFASMIRVTIIKMLLALTIKYDYEVEQMNVIITFLEAHLKEEIWMQQSSKFEQKESNGTFLACRLNKALYGLKQAPREWYATLKVYLIFIDYQRVEIDHSMFTHENGIIIVIYVNDLLILEPDIFDIEALKLQFAERFQMKDLGSIEWYLDMHITRDRAERILWINQFTYIKRVIELLSMSDCSPTKTSMHHKCQLKKNVYRKFKKWVEYQATSEEIGGYQSIIETLMWIACQTRSDIAYAVGKCNRYSTNPTLDHDLAVKQIIRYLVETAQLRLRYESFKMKGVERAEFFGYTDSAHADCLDSRKFTFHYMFFLWNEPISWSFKRQQCISTSFAEAEYVDECNAAKELTFLVQALKEVGYDGSNTNSTIILADNQAAIKMGSNLVNHPRSKHIDTSYHYVRNKVEEEAIRLEYIPIDQMVADGLTKPLESGKFLRFRSVMGLASSNEATPAEHGVDE
jgi:transposase InsO family protein